MKLMKYYNINVRRRVENIHIILYIVQFPCEGIPTHTCTPPHSMYVRVPRYARAASDAAAGHDTHSVSCPRQEKTQMYYHLI